MSGRASKTHTDRIHPSLHRWLGFGVLVGGLAFVASLLFHHGPSDRMSRILQEGVESVEAGRTDQAEESFLIVSQSLDTLLASAAHHNLGVLLLREALEARGEGAREAARSSAAHSEASLMLTPGRTETAWNMELALRQLATAGPSDRSGRDPSGTQQEKEGPADTESEVSDPSDQAGDPSGVPQPGFSEETARRLLASFRLMERDGTMDAISALVASGPKRAGLKRRGPPW